MHAVATRVTQAALTADRLAALAEAVDLPQRSRLAGQDTRRGTGRAGRWAAGQVHARVLPFSASTTSGTEQGPVIREGRGELAGQ